MNVSGAVTGLTAMTYIVALQSRDARPNGMRTMAMM
jgi:hypothetical protein